ncbi:MAG: glycine zipper 2TM domain-containing protein [Comamonas sp.]
MSAPSAASAIGKPSRENVLWAAIGALVVALLCLIGLMAWGRSSPGIAAAAPLPAEQLQAQPQALASGGAAGNAMAPQAWASQQGAMAGQAQPPSQAMQAPAMMPAAQPVEQPMAPPPVAACKTCGVVESVTPVQHAAQPSGVGMVAGGVLGGVLGNQVGKGTGRTLATVAGAVGGGYVGHQVEKRMHTTTSYRIAVRMDDGRLRTVDRGEPVAVGSPVWLNGQKLSLAGAASQPAPAPRQAPAYRQQAPVTTAYTGG